MSRQTNFEVSCALDKAGFMAFADGMYVQVLAGEEAGTWKWIEGHETARCNPHSVLSYRADTLEEWLLALDAKEVAAKMGLRTLAENGRYGALRSQKLDNAGYHVQLYRPMEVGAQDVVLADALGHLVCEVMKEMEVMA